MAFDFVSYLKSKKVLLLLGPGGVGKTTSSIAMAVIAARSGLRVGLLSIDPAKRLAAALGMELNSELKEISLGENIKLKGSIEAAMLDQKAVFDNMVRRYAKDESAAKKILSHSLYQAASTKLAGPLEYMALSKLLDMVESAKYDLVVLDTPPDTHALDFLRRPNLLAGFMENKVMSWLIKPFYLAGKLGVTKLFTLGDKLMGGLAKVTGFNALNLLAEFLVLMQEVIDGFHDSGKKIVEILKDEKTGFFLVTTPSISAVRSSSNLLKQLTSMDYRLDAIIANRGLSEEIVTALSRVKNSPEHENKIIKNLERRLELEKQCKTRLAKFKTLGNGQVDMIEISEKDYALHNGESLIKLAKELEL